MAGSEIKRDFRGASARRPPLLLCILLAILPAAGARAQCVPSALKRALNRPFPVAGDLFGRSVAVSGNLAVVGACCADPGGISAAGIAYVFDATTGALVATLNNPAPATDDRFGSAVGISGTLAVVGAGEDNPGGVADAGSAYVFNATTGGLITTLNNPAPATGDFFGVSVGISGNAAVVGAYHDDPSGVADAGTAYVFNATTGALTATLGNPARAAGDDFGFSAGISGNLAVVGALHDDPGGVIDVGGAYVFNATTGALTSTLANPSPTASDSFGWSVAISSGMAVVGVVNDDPGGIQNAGRAYVFNAATGALTTTLLNPTPSVDDYFGVSVGISGNLAIVGADYDDVGAISQAGAAFVFDATNGSLRATLNNPAPTSQDYFSYSSAISGDVVIVGAWFDDPGGLTQAGTAYIFGCPPNAVEYWNRYE